MREEYELEAREKVNSLVSLRWQQYSQTEMSRLLKVSLKSIYNFENYLSLNNGYLFWGYEKLLK